MNTPAAAVDVRTSSSPSSARRALLGRYAAVFGAAWQARRALDGTPRTRDERAFLPAAMALQETPLHPAPRVTAITLCALFALAVAWACLGQVDIVAVAPGRIVVSDGTKTVQPLETSVVKRILVRDGDAVREGQVLIELDATAARADETTVKQQLEAAEGEIAHTRAMLAAIAAGRPPAAAAQAKDLRLQAEWQDLTARLARLDAEQARRAAETTTAQQHIAKLEATLPIVRQREDDLQSLTGEGFINKHAAQDKARERIELERDLQTQRARLAEAQATARESQQTRAAYLAESRRALSERHSKAGLERDQLMQQRTKSEQRAQLTQLAAPVSGTVQQLAVHTPGGVVTPAQSLMVIVPSNAEVRAEVALENKDVGFVEPGQAAEVKIETFAFTRYGTIPATVVSVSPDAVIDDKRGAYFPAVLRLSSSTIDVEGKPVKLAPGMNLSAEVKTGSRTLADYLASPVRRTTSESMRER